MKYKYSRYNWFFEYDSHHTVVANGFTGAMALIEPKYIEIFKKYFQYDLEIDTFLEELDEKVIENLQHGGFIVESDFCERRMLQFMFKCHTYSKPSSLTVVPTMACNFACTYCYQDGGESDCSVIKNEVIDKIVEYADKNESHLFKISFTGGEPLLKPNRVIEICKRVTEARAKHGRLFRADIITNGYTLTEEILKKLKSYNVVSMQITLDGDEETHNLRRPLKDGSDTFSKVIKNIKLAAKFMILNIRVNCESGHDKQFTNVKELLKDVENIRITPAYTRYDHRKQEEKTRRNAEFLYSKLSYMPTEKCLSTFKPRIAGCAATNAYGIVILPDGTTCKCWHEISGVLKGRYGNMLSEHSNPISDTAKLWKWMDFDPYTEDSPCYECKILPNCGGGCPANWVLESANSCTQKEYKNQFHNYLFEAASRLLSNDKSQENGKEEK